jgi:hypothetical protein
LADADRVVNIIGAGISRTYGLQLTGLDVLTRNTSTSVTTLTANGTLTLSSSATTVTGTLTLAATTASTTTSSGALVVGNGTQGGLGVGGAINAGSSISSWTGTFVARAASANPSFYAWTENTVADRGVLGFEAASSTLKYRAGGYSMSTGTEVFSITSAGNTTVSGTLTVSGSSVGIGTAVDAAVGINSRPTITTGSFQYGLYSTPTVNASTSDSGFFSMITAASSAVGSAFLLRAFTPTLGSSSTITNAFGLRIENIGATGVTNAWGIDIAAQSGGSGSNVGLRNAGTTLLTNTTASTSTSSGALVVSGGVGVAKEVYVGTTLKLANTSQSVTAWGDIGAQLSVAGAVITDTSSSGTVSRAVVNSIAASALAASSTTTYTQAASLFVAGAPTANTNVTITNAYAIYTAGGRINFQGLPTSSAGLQAGTLWNDGGTLKIA